MNLERMLKKCRNEQWHVGELDWTVKPRSMTRDEEMAIVQYFTDMAEIERLAGALFEEQRRRMVGYNETLEKIFETFVTDELRHAHVAQMLADHYDVHKYEYYRPSPHLTRFAPHFVHATRFLSAEIANLYITTGELILDVALLRSIDDYVDDDMSHQAMDKINRDESRHIAIDYHMVDFYSSAAYEKMLEEAPDEDLAHQLRAWWAFANVLRFARPFIRDVFFEPMERVDPTGKRIREAFKRIQLLAAKERVAERPFNKFILRMQRIHNSRLMGPIFGRVVERVLGVDSAVIATLYTADEWNHAKKASFEQLAADALSAKFAPA